MFPKVKIVRVPKPSCDDCEEELEPGRKRKRCKRCGLLVCAWCYSHVHALAQSTGRDASAPGSTGCVGPLALEGL